MKIFYCLIFTLLLLSTILFAQQTQNDVKKLVILHTNDLHSNLNGFSPELEYTPNEINNDNTVGGFARIASIITQEKEKSGDKNVLVVDAGDFLMGTFFHVLERESGFQLNLMKKMGFDILCVGNHEFDFGPNMFAKIVRSNLEKGEIPGLVLSNVEFDQKSPDDDLFEEIFKEDIVRKYYVLERAGLKIGVFGIYGIDALEVEPTIAPLKITNQVKIAKQMVKKLKKEEKVDFVVCLSHSGVYKADNGKWIGEDINLAKKVKGIDVIVSGHTHVLVPKPIVVGKTLIVQTGAMGKKLGRLELDINNGEILSSKYDLIDVDDKIQGDAEIQEMVSSKIDDIDNKILKNLNYSYNKPIVETSFKLFCDETENVENSNIGPLIADAMLYYVNNHSSSKADISMVAAGVIRSDINVGKKGVQTVADIFKIMCLGEGDDNVPGYPIAMVYLTPKEIKSIAELLIIACRKSPAYYCFYSGVEVYYDNSKSILNKIYKMKINGEEIDFSKKNKKLYSLCSDSYMLEFVGKVNSMSLGLIKVKPKDKNGNPITDNKSTWIDFDDNKEGVQEGKEWIALMKYFKSFKDVNGNNIPDIPEYYKNPNKSAIKKEKE